MTNIILQQKKRIPDRIFVAMHTVEKQLTTYGHRSELLKLQNLEYELIKSICYEKD